MADIIPAPSGPIELQIQQQAIQRQRDLALLLQKDSMTPVEGQMISGHYVAPSWTQMASKLANGLMGKYQQSALDDKQIALAKSYDGSISALAQSMINGGAAPVVAAGGGAGGVTPQALAGALRPDDGMGNVGAFAPVGGAAGVGAPQAGGNPLFKGMTPQVLSNFIQQPDSAFGKIAQLQMQANSKGMEPTDIMKSLRAAGIPEGSPQWNKALQDVVAKGGYIPVTPIRPGSFIKSPDGSMTQVPAVPEGYQAVDNGNGGFKIVPVEGGREAIADTAGAKAAGQAAYQTERVWDAASGRYVIQTKANIANAANGTSGQAQAPRFVGQDLLEQLPANVRDGILNNAKSGNGKFNLNYQLPDGRRISGAVDLNSAGGASAPGSAGAPNGGAFAAEPALGQETTATGTAKDAVANWSEQHKFATASAPRNLGLLQSIAQLADKTLTGPGANKAMFVNGVLNTMGIPVGQDATQNYQIMSKNLNMLVGSQRMGAAGGGSDALQSLLTASNPNVKEMNAPALKEAAHELIAYNRMMMAHDKALPNPNTVSSQAYAETETKLAAYRDPRLWQLEHADSDKERVRILSLVPESERGALLKKAREARQLGILN